MGEWKPDKTVVVEAPDKMIGLEKASHVHLWIAQEFQRFRGRLEKGAATLEFDGRIEGETLRSPRNVNLRVEGNRLNLQAISKDYAALQGGTFARSRGPNCN